jgi:hypothetical protein
MIHRRSFALIAFVGGAAAAAACSANDARAPAPSPDGGASPLDASVEASPSADGAPLDTGDALTGCDAENASGQPPTHLACTGLFSDFASKTPATNAREYKPAAALWSDGLAKTRWIMLPAGTKIDTSDMDAWSFPSGTKLWKEFRIGAKRIETRFYWKNGPAEPCASGMCATWLWTTYRWSDDETNAVRLTGGEKNVAGTTWEIPSEGQCDQCHGGHPDKVLGFEALNLGLDGATGVTLATLRSEGRLTNPPPTDSYALPDDGTGMATSALRWLHANCGTPCHNPNGLASNYTPLTLRVRTAELAAADGGAARAQDLDAYRTAVGQSPHALAQYAAQGYLVIAPGDPAKSLLPFLAGTRDSANVPQMPPLGSHVVDDAGLSSVTSWIGAMGGADAGAEGGGETDARGD